jgi:tetratricopeptide (TPR) repeat protein
LISIQEFEKLVKDDLLAAVDYADRLLTSNPESYLYFICLGDNYRSILQYDVAEGYYKKSFEFRPDNSHAALKYAEFLFDIDNEAYGLELLHKYQRDNSPSIPVFIVLNRFKLLPLPSVDTFKEEIRSIALSYLLDLAYL